MKKRVDLYKLILKEGRVELGTMNGVMVLQKPMKKVD